MGLPPVTVFLIKKKKESLEILVKHGSLGRISEVPLLSLGIKRE
jgi:hypothetical protein